MKAVQFREYGGPEVLEVVETAAPQAGPGQVRITVRAAAVNAIDWKIRSGFMQQMQQRELPSGTGLDAAGVVDQVGEGVTGVSVGDKVFGAGSATFAEQAVLTGWAPIPDGLSFEEAAGYPVPVETSIRILDAVGVKAGETLLVSGAAGGVGSAAVQIARRRGLRVVGTAGPGNQDYLRSLGVEATTYDEGWVERVRAITPDGVDAALDIAGAGVIPELVELTGDPQRVVSIADFSAGQHGAQTSTGGGNMTAALAEAARLFEEGALHIPVERTFPLAEAGAAQRISQTGHVRGRLIVTID